jgi:hypothetical protein
MYDGAGNRTLYEGFEWKNNAWVATNKTVYEYDGARRTTFSYNWENNAWVGSDKLTHAYDNKGEEISMVHYHWTNNQWVVYLTSYYEKKTVNPKFYVYHTEFDWGDWHFHIRF